MEWILALGMCLTLASASGPFVKHRGMMGDVDQMLEAVSLLERSRSLLTPTHLTYTPAQHALMG